MSRFFKTNLIDVSSIVEGSSPYIEPITQVEVQSPYFKDGGLGEFLWKNRAFEGEEKEQELRSLAEKKDWVGLEEAAGIPTGAFYPIGYAADYVKGIKAALSKFSLTTTSKKIARIMVEHGFVNSEINKDNAEMTPNYPNIVGEAAIGKTATSKFVCSITGVPNTMVTYSGNYTTDEAESAPTNVSMDKPTSQRIAVNFANMGFFNKNPKAMLSYYRCAKKHLDKTDKALSKAEKYAQVSEFILADDTFAKGFSEFYGLQEMALAYSSFSKQGAGICFIGGALISDEYNAAHKTAKENVKKHMDEFRENVAKYQFSDLVRPVAVFAASNPTDDERYMLEKTSIAQQSRMPTISVTGENLIKPILSSYFIGLNDSGKQNVISIVEQVEPEISASFSGNKESSSPRIGKYIKEEDRELLSKIAIVQMEKLGKDLNDSSFVENFQSSYGKEPQEFDLRKMLLVVDNLEHRMKSATRGGNLLDAGSSLNLMKQSLTAILGPQFGIDDEVKELENETTTIVNKDGISKIKKSEQDRSNEPLIVSTINRFFGKDKIEYMMADSNIEKPAAKEVNFNEVFESIDPSKMKFDDFKSGIKFAKFKSPEDAKREAEKIVKSTKEAEGRGRLYIFGFETSGKKSVILASQSKGQVSLEDVDLENFSVAQIVKKAMALKSATICQPRADWGSAMGDGSGFGVEEGRNISGHVK